MRTIAPPRFIRRPAARTRWVLAPRRGVSPLQQLVVLSGLPASGKTSLGHAIASALSFPCIDKDEILEGLFDTHGVGGVDHRRALSRLADLRMAEAVAALPAAVVVSWWRHPRSSTPTGTAPWWLDSAELQPVEVHCSCPAPCAAERFLARRRHPGHLDARWRPADLVRTLAEQGSLGPLSEGALLVSTERPLQDRAKAELVDAVRLRLNRPGL